MTDTKKLPAGLLGDVREELKKVTWPSRRNALALTITVFFISLIVGLYVGIIDVLLAKILEFLSTTR